MWKRAQQRTDRDLAFHPGQRRAEAVVDAEAEGEVAVGVAEEVEVVGIVEDRLVAVGGGEDGVDEGAGGEGGAGEGDRLAGVALGRGFERAAETEELFDGGSVVDQIRALLTSACSARSAGPSMPYPQGQLRATFYRCPWPRFACRD